MVCSNVQKALQHTITQTVDLAKRTENTCWCVKTKAEQRTRSVTGVGTVEEMGVPSVQGLVARRSMRRMSGDAPTAANHVSCCAYQQQWHTIVPLAHNFGTERQRKAVNAERGEDTHIYPYRHTLLLLLVPLALPFQVSLVQARLPASCGA